MARAKKPNYEQLGRMLENIYESGYADRNQMYKNSFIKGVLAGFGGAVGATVVLAIVIWVLSLFSNVPVIGRIVQNLEKTVNQAQTK